MDTIDKIYLIVILISTVFLMDQILTVSNSHRIRDLQLQVKELQSYHIPDDCKEEE